MSKQNQTKLIEAIPNLSINKILITLKPDGPFRLPKQILGRAGVAAEVVPVQSLDGQV